MLTEPILYTLTAILLYVISDWLLQRMELAAGRRFQYRSLIFFFILAFLALASFSVIQYIINYQ
jgi:hypothetical protein